jgi:hypothetical protein
MWKLDPERDRDLIEQLRARARYPDILRVDVGRGWRDLVQECHERLSEDFPGYTLLAVKQKYGVLAFQASHQRGGVDDLTDDFADRSEEVCEWCGAPGELRGWRRWELTLCDACDARFPDPPYDLEGKSPKRTDQGRP